jgi:cellulose synthase/poly-beta-1,6-N-acetylglucosamine synthase-like glycosyltransferase
LRNVKKIPRIKSSKKFELLVVIVIIILAPLGMLGHLQSEHMLLTQFANNGEEFRKGLGHILSENFEPGLKFLTIRYISIAIIFCPVFVIAIVSHKRFMTILNIIITLFFIAFCIYIGEKTWSININQWDGTNRLIEISIRYGSFLFVYLISFLSITYTHKKKNTLTNKL